MAVGNDRRLGAILLELGYIHEDQVKEALDLQNIRPKRIGEILMDLGYVEEDHVLEALSLQFDIPFEKDIAADVDAALTTRVPINFIREYEMVPYRKNGEAYYVATHDPVNLMPLDDLRILLDGPIKPVLCREADIQSILDGYFDQQGEMATDMIETITMTEDDPVYSLDEEVSDRDARSWLWNTILATGFLETYPYFAPVFAMIDVVAHERGGLMAVSLHEGRVRLHVNIAAFEEDLSGFRGVLQHELHHLPGVR